MNDWERPIPELLKIKVMSHPNNEPVTIEGETSDLRCIGVGTDAAVFESLSTPGYAYKLYANEKKEKVAMEAKVYGILGESVYFPVCYGAYDEFLVLSYEKGITLFDCILQGVHIPKQAVQDVEDARDYVRSKGLNPRDIHLKNILLQNGRAKIIDVSEYVLPGNDFRWEHLKQGYEQYYHLIDGSSVPFWLVETVRKWYNQRAGHSSFEEFSRRALRLLFKK
ncbi:serine/threonine protein kinase [Jeotgalibacillus proteolyticus]|uniref:Serine/threonine protein kinase n=1 Tax=Jeotgalibacillus proteolyticus TaxID=2082395 RepID=A0A2S5G969_9BACL|nr:serine/threonine protein kinase [Jeotgalibacillus proteolyticus]PPA69550.1 serine/threonine protein kinase [Jeotgalibacillus proteolyticus]